MKKTLKSIIILVSFLVCFACNSENDILDGTIMETTTLEESLSFQAPNGYMISADLGALKIEVGACLKEAYGIDKFELTQINYVHNIQNGYIAFIYYLTDEGKVGNLIKSNMKLKLKGTKLVNVSHVMTKTNQEGGGGSYVYQCIERLGKVCNIGCGICSSTTQPNEYQCTCVDECAMLVTERP